MKTLHVGIASYEDMKTRTMAIARGSLKPSSKDPKIWFSSAESFAKVLSDKNRVLLDIIRKAQPDSVAELAALSGRKKSNLSRTLKTMERYKLVSLHKTSKGKLVAHVPYGKISLTLPIGKVA
jgi:predicted transcriptional regulator